MAAYRQRRTKLRTRKKKAAALTATAALAVSAAGTARPASAEPAGAAISRHLSCQVPDKQTGGNPDGGVLNWYRNLHSDVWLEGHIGSDSKGVIWDREEYYYTGRWDHYVWSELLNGWVLQSSESLAHYNYNQNDERIWFDNKNLDGRGTGYWHSLDSHPYDVIGAETRGSENGNFPRYSPRNTDIKMQAALDLGPETDPTCTSTINLNWVSSKK